MPIVYPIAALVGAVLIMRSSGTIGPLLGPYPLAIAVFVALWAVVVLWVRFAMRFPLTAWFVMGFVRGLTGRR
jgi:hypothetical protein